MYRGTALLLPILDAGDRGDGLPSSLAGVVDDGVELLCRASPKKAAEAAAAAAAAAAYGKTPG